MDGVTRLDSRQPAPRASRREPSRRSQATVERGRELERDTRTTLRVEAPVSAERGARVRREEADLDLDAGRAQAPETASIDDRMRIAGRDHAATNAGVEDRAHARRRAADMGAGLEGHVERGAARARSRLLEGHGLGMGRPERAMPALAHDASALHDERAHHGIGAHASAAPLGHAQRAPHERHLVHSPEPSSEKERPRRRRRQRGMGHRLRRPEFSGSFSHPDCDGRLRNLTGSAKRAGFGRRVRSRAVPPVGTFAPPRRRCGRGE